MTSSDRSRSDHVQNALEATCDALMTLEAIGVVEDAAGSPGKRVRLAQAIASLRRGVTELRLAHGADESVVALGFVVDTGPERRPGAAPP
jgi:hypothetical protein